MKLGRMPIQFGWGSRIVFSLLYYCEIGRFHTFSLISQGIIMDFDRLDGNLTFECIPIGADPNTNLDLGNLNAVLYAYIYIKYNLYKL